MSTRMHARALARPSWKAVQLKRRAIIRQRPIPTTVAASLLVIPVTMEMPVQEATLLATIACVLVWILYSAARTPRHATTIQRLKNPMVPAFTLVTLAMMDSATRSMTFTRAIVLVRVRWSPPVQRALRWRNTPHQNTERLTAYTRRLMRQQMS